MTATKDYFSDIAPSYDRMNSILSLAMHRKWNGELAASVSGAKKLLDLCAGTGEIAFHFLEENPQATATLLDFCPQMLEVAQQKGKERFEIVVGDAQELPFANESFDAATIAYGIRNVEMPIRCFRETYRVLQLGGRFSILELTRPSGILRYGHSLYLTMLPFVGRMVAKNGAAYAYLRRSIQSFAAPEMLMEQMSEVGFVHIQKKKLLGGTATLITAQKC